MKKKSSALIFVLILIVVFLILVSAIMSRSVSERDMAKRNAASTQGLWLAEAASSRALYELKRDPTVTGYNLFPTTLNTGQYNCDIQKSDQTHYIVTGRGGVPSGCNFNSASCSAIRTIKVGMKQLEEAPANFYNNVLYVSHDLSKGKTIDGNVIYNGTNGSKASIKNGTFTKDSTASPLGLLNFQELRNISKNQHHYNPNTVAGNTWPTSFWYSPPSQSNPIGTPNVVFIEGSLTVSGNSSIYGFIIVGGETTYDATISGNTSVVGAIYTIGNFTVNGGGNALNVDGGIWAGGSANLGGSGTFSYNKPYMDAIKNLGITMDVQFTSWEESQSPYPVN